MINFFPTLIGFRSTYLDTGIQLPCKHKAKVALDNLSFILRFKGNRFLYHWTMLEMCIYVVTACLVLLATSTHLQRNMHAISFLFLFIAVGFKKWQLL